MMETTELYEKYFFKITHFVYQIIENWHDSEDITQDIFLRYLCLDKTERVMNGSINYLYKCARNKGIDYTRRRQKFYEYYNLSMEEGEPYEEKHLDKELEDENRHKLNQIVTEINSMPESKYKKILIQHVVNNKPVEMIAKEYNIAKHSVYTFRQHGISKIREKFGINEK